MQPVVCNRLCGYVFWRTLCDKASKTTTGISSAARTVGSRSKSRRQRTKDTSLLCAGGSHLLGAWDSKKLVTLKLSTAEISKE